MNISSGRFIYILLVLFTSFSNFSFAQEIDTVYVNIVLEKARKDIEDNRNQLAIDSLNVLLEKLENPQLLLKKEQTLSLLADVYAREARQGEAAEILEQKIQLLLTQPKRLKALGQTYELQCFYYYRNEQFDRAIASGEEALKISTVTKDSITRLYAINEMSHCYFSQGKWDSCTVYAYRGLELARQMADSGYIASHYMILGRMSKAQKEFEAAESFYKQAIEIYTQLNDSSRVLPPMNDLGILYKTTKNYPKAIDIYEKAISIAKKRKQGYQQRAILINLAYVSIESEDYGKAAEYMIEIENTNNDGALKESRIEESKLKAILSLQKKQYASAVKHIEDAYEVALENGVLPKLPPILKIKEDIFVQKGDYKAAYETAKEYAVYKDSLINTEKNKVIDELQLRFETTEKERRLQEQENEIELANVRFRAFIFGAILLVILGLGMAYVWRRRNELRRKELANEQALLIEKNKSLEEVNQLKSRFFNNISHELRTPLSLITTPISHILTSLKSLSKEEIQQSLKVVLRNANSLLQIVEEILEISRLEAGKMELDERPLNVREFSQRIFNLHHSRAEYKGIDYQFNSDISAEIKLLIDRKKLEKIINNLLSNALKYTDQGRVSMQVKLAALPETSHFLKSQADRILIIKIEDSGRGIPEEDIPFVFDRYFQSKSKELPIEGGTGIGLSLSRELVNLMGGTIEVVSEWGKGSIFTVNLPAVETQLSTEEISEKETREQEEILESSTPIAMGDPLIKGEKPNLLIVEDNEDVQWMIKNLLHGNYQCQVANNGEEALDFLKTIKSHNLPSLILSDIMMPQMDGYELLDQLKSNQEWRHIPVVLLTARAEMEDKLRALRLGVDDYVIKPFSPEELIARIENLLVNYGKRKSFIEEEKSTVNIEFEEVNGADQIWLQGLEEIAKDALDKKIAVSAAYLAGQIALSERQLRRRLQVLTGLNTKQYIQEVKLQKARHLLENKAFMSVSEIAYACGFNTPGYFTKLYLKHFGKKPLDYLTN